MFGWHHWLDGHEFEQTSWVGDGPGSLVCCSQWVRKESDVTEWLNWLTAGMYMFLCYSLCSSSRPQLLPPLCLLFCLHLHFCPADRVTSTILLDSTCMHQHMIFVFLFFFLLSSLCIIGFRFIHLDFKYQNCTGAKTVSTHYVIFKHFPSMCVCCVCVFLGVCFIQGSLFMW